MKRKLLVIAAIFMVFTLIFTAGSCEPLEALGELFGGSEPAPDIDPADVLGRWTREASFGRETYTFYDDGKYTHTKAGDASQGDYQISGNEITTRPYENSKGTSTHITRFSDDKKTMTWGEGPVQNIFTKEE